jgi:hypothetical protein
VLDLDLIPVRVHEANKPLIHCDLCHGPTLPSRIWVTHEQPYAAYVLREIRVTKDPEVESLYTEDILKMTLFGRCCSSVCHGAMHC